MSRLTTLVVALLLAAAKPGLAQTPLTLDECVRRVLSQNLSIKISQVAQQQTAEKIRETKAGLMPQLSGTYNYNYNPNLPPTFLPGFIVGQPQVESVGAVLGLKQTQYVGVQASQQLFNPQLLVALKVAKTATNLTGLQLEKVREDLVYNVSSTYYSLQTLRKQAELLKINIRSFDKTRAVTQVLVQNGMAKQSDVSRITLQQKSLETQLANLAVTENTLLNALRLLMNLPETDSLAVQTEQPATGANYFAVNGLEPRRRVDARLLGMQTDLKQLEIKSVQAAYLPTLIATAGYFSYAYAKDFNPFERFASTSYPVSAVGLNLSIPIYDGGQKAAKIRQLTSDLQTLGYQQQLQTAQVQTEIDNARKKYAVTLASLQTQQENRQLAETILAETQTNYAQGLSSLTDVITAENDLHKAQTDYLVALINIRIAGLDIKKAYGTLLTDYN